jgi:hypothetical protein
VISSLGMWCHIVDSYQGCSGFADEKHMRRILDKIVTSRCMDFRNLVPFQRIAWLDAISPKEGNDDSVSLRVELEVSRREGMAALLSYL